MKANVVVERAVWLLLVGFAWFGGAELLLTLPFSVAARVWWMVGLLLFFIPALVCLGVGIGLSKRDKAHKTGE